MIRRQILAALAVVLTTIAMAGCTDKDRAMTNKKSDGTETFHFKPPTSLTPPPAKKNTSEEAQASTPNQQSDDATASFKFKPYAEPSASVPKSTGR